MTAIPARAARIIARVAALHHLRVSELTGRDASRRCVIPRQHLYAELYDQRAGNCSNGTYTLPQIGAWLGRDHSTVWHGIRAHEARQSAERQGRAE